MNDDSIVATMFERDAPLWNEDVVEVFLAPGELSSYIEIEVSPRGTVFDARIAFPGPDRSTMVVESDWDCSGLSAYVRRDLAPLHRAHIAIRIPFDSVAANRPGPGTSWRANFYRIDRSSQGDSFTAWSPTYTERPDFHVPSRFGVLRF